jgi:hypothetical protein
VRQDAAQEDNVGLQPPNGELIKHRQQSQARLFVVLAPGDQLAQHRVVERRYHDALAD